MQTGLPSTVFTQPPHFRWLIILYFFIGGIAGGALLLASLLRLFGRPEDRPFVRLASYLSFAGAVLSGIILIVDLGVPWRFWHMLIQDHTGRPILKWWSPMSAGAWGLLVFGFFSFLASLGALAEEGRLTRRSFRRLADPPIATLGAIGGMFGGLFLAGYTGVLLSVSNRPIWSDSNWLGVLFLLSGLSTAVAALLLFARRRGVDVPVTIGWLRRFDRTTLLLELLVIVAFIVSLGAAARAFVSLWGVVLVLGVIGVGILMPLWMYRDRAGANHDVVRAATYVLVGGFLLRVVVLLSSEQVHVVGTQVFR